VLGIDFPRRSAHRASDGQFFREALQNRAQSKNTKEQRSEVSPIQNRKEVKNMRHISLQLQKLEERIAPGGCCCGTGGSHKSGKSGGSHKSGGSKSHGSKSHGSK